MTHDSWGSTFSRRSTIKLTTGMDTKSDLGRLNAKSFDFKMELHGCLTVSIHDYLILFIYFLFFSLVRPDVII